MRRRERRRRPSPRLVGAGRVGTVLRLAQDRVDRGVARHLVALVLEDVGGPLILALGEVRRRHDQLGARPGGDLRRPDPPRAATNPNRPCRPPRSDSRSFMPSKCRFATPSETVTRRPASGGAIRSDGTVLAGSIVTASGPLTGIGDQPRRPIARGVAVTQATRRAWPTWIAARTFESTCADADESVPPQSVELGPMPRVEVRRRGLLGRRPQSRCRRTCSGTTVRRRSVRVGAEDC